MKGVANGAWTIAGFVYPLQILAFECIPKLKDTFRIEIEGRDAACPRMCKTMFAHCNMKGWPLEELYEKLGSPEEIQSILETDFQIEEILLERILDNGPCFEDHDMIQDGWNEHLEAEKKICWKDLYDADVAAQASILIEKTVPVTDLDPEKNPALLQFITNLEDRMKKEMAVEFEKVNIEVEDLKKKNNKLRMKARVQRTKVRVLRAEVKTLKTEMKSYSDWYGVAENEYGGFEEVGGSEKEQGDGSRKEQGGGSGKNQEETVKETEALEMDTEKEKEAESEERTKEMELEKESEKAGENEKEQDQEKGDSGKEEEQEIEEAEDRENEEAEGEEDGVVKQKSATKQKRVRKPSVYTTEDYTPTGKNTIRNNAAGGKRKITKKSDDIVKKQKK
ncbi:hypothetical protein AALP_AA7G122300 [Arabis alpina]|nr:hypothetical protein AALP_AA7G122300 [Arabis alpina]